MRSLNWWRVSGQTFIFNKTLNDVYILVCEDKNLLKFIIVKNIILQYLKQINKYSAVYKLF